MTFTNVWSALAFLGIIAMTAVCAIGFLLGAIIALGGGGTELLSESSVGLLLGLALLDCRSLRRRVAKLEGRA